MPLLTTTFDIDKKSKSYKIGTYFSTTFNFSKRSHELIRNLPVMKWRADQEAIN